MSYLSLYIAGQACVSATDIKPHAAISFIIILLQGVIGITLILIGDFNSILTFSGFVHWIIEGFAFFSVIVLRRKYPTRSRPFKASLTTTKT